MLGPIKIMPSEKTKKLLDNLKNITAKKDRFEKHEPSSTNRHWPDNGITFLPRSYDNAKRHKDNDGEEFIYMDRIYGNIYGDDNLVQKDGTKYEGKIYKKRRLCKGIDGNNFYSECRVTADGRWFDNSGIPIEPPKSVEVEKEEDKEETSTIESWSSEPKEDPELNMLKKLK